MQIARTLFGSIIPILVRYSGLFWCTSYRIWYAKIFVPDAENIRIQRLLIGSQQIDGSQSDAPKRNVELPEFIRIETMCQKIVSPKNSKIRFKWHKMNFNIHTCSIYWHLLPPTAPSHTTDNVNLSLNSTECETLAGAGRVMNWREFGRIEVKLENRIMPFFKISRLC